MTRLILALTTAVIAAIFASARDAAPATGRADVDGPSPAHLAMFEPGTTCLACHNGLSTATGEDVSIGSAWQASMMAHAARDPYWHAAVRREVLDHPKDQAAIEDECSACHMPMSRVIAKQAGRGGQIFAHLPVGQAATTLAPLAADGVSCTVCHQIQPDNFGTKASFNGGFVVAPAGPAEGRSVFGPFEIDRGLARVMHSSSRFAPAEGRHVQQSELCATCHSLYTHARGPGGAIVGELPEQTPYGEWLHSAYRQERSCQSCHMPEVETPAPVASVLGSPRDRLSRHTFVGANAFMLRMLNRYRAELGVVAPAEALEASAVRTERHLAEATATLALPSVRHEGGAVVADVVVGNLAGHKLPTGYPARRVWLHVRVHDREGRVVFDSGGIESDGRIRGNDADRDPAAGEPVGVEPHFTEITRGEDVQIYESAMVDHAGRPTTGLLSGVRFVKDNRLLPRGFDKATAPADVEVRGPAAGDVDFVGGEDRVRYRMVVERAAGPFAVEAVLRYQPIAYRWAQNLRAYDAPETQRFVRYYESMAAGSSSVLARATARID